MSNKLWDGVSRGSNSWTSRLTTYERKISPLYVGPWLGSSRWGQLGRNIQIYSCHWNCFNLIIVSIQELFLYWQQRWWWWFDETVCLTWGLLKWRCNQFVARWTVARGFAPGFIHFHTLQIYFKDASQWISGEKTRNGLWPFVFKKYDHLLEMKNSKIVILNWF